jgi:DNA-binding protein HU-beta
MAEAAKKRMTTSQLVKELAGAGEISNKAAKAILDKLVAVAVSETKKSGLFVLPGIGRLKRVERKARMGRNPMTGAAIKIPAKKVVKLTLSKSLKDQIVPPKKK